MRLSGTTLFVLSLAAGPASAQTGISAQPVGPRRSSVLMPYCPDTVRDLISHDCVPISSRPAFGALYPLGPELNIDSMSGNVGIGTMTPTERLSVLGTIHALSGGFRFPDGTLQTTATSNCPGEVRDQVTQGCVSISSVPALGSLYPLGPELNISAAGNVGIGTLIPAERLTVLGTIQSLSGGFRFPDGSLQTTAVTTCAEEVRDQITQSCVQVSSLPTLGSLYPLGPEFDIAASGNVGIGTTNPGEKLTVAGTIHSTSGGVRFPDGTLQTTATSNCPAQVRDQATQSCVPISSVPSLGSIYPLGPEFDIAASGNVGIGTTNPGEKLTVTGTIHSTSGGIRFPDGTLQTTATSNCPAQVRDQATQSCVPISSVPALGSIYPLGQEFDIAASGNVGIGTTNPGEKLTVAGTIHATSGGVRFPDGTLQTSAATGGPTRTPEQIATLRWYDVSETGDTFSVGMGPLAPACDGSNIWVANRYSNDVTKLRASDGEVLGTFAVGSLPTGIAFDGSSIWVANSGSSSVTKLRARDGLTLGTFSVGAAAYYVAFDGSSVWVTHGPNNTVSKLRASDGAILGTYAAGSNPYGIAYDGANMWVVNYGSHDVTKLQASDGAYIGTYPVGVDPELIAFDGTSLWITNNSGNDVTRLRASDGANLGTYAVGASPYGIAYDGSTMWVVNQGGGTVTRLRASDGANLGTYPAGASPTGAAFDGASMWVADFTSGKVAKL